MDEFAEQVEKGQVKGDATQSIKDTEHLPPNCTRGKVSITCKEWSHMRALSIKNERLQIKHEIIRSKEWLTVKATPNIPFPSYNHVDLTPKYFKIFNKKVSHILYIPIVVTTVPAKKNELLKSQLLGLVEFPEGFTLLSQASTITYSGAQKGQSCWRCKGTKWCKYPAYNKRYKEDIYIK